MATLSEVSNTKYTLTGQSAFSGQLLFLSVVEMSGEMASCCWAWRTPKSPPSRSTEKEPWSILVVVMCPDVLA